MENSYKLIVMNGPNPGAEFSLDKDELYLGRDANNDIVINDPEVSRRHARFVKQNGNYYYEDLGSTNGSFINEQRLSALTLLSSGTKITIGERVVLFYQVEVTDPNATVVMSRKSDVKVAAPPAFVPPSAPIPSPVMPPQMPIPSAPATAPAAPQKMSKAAKVILIIIAILLVFCVIPWLIMELTDSYCNFLAGFFNLIQPGSCP